MIRVITGRLQIRMLAITKEVVEETLANAKEVLEEAGILFSNGRHARAYALAVLSAEEFSKAFLYRVVLAGITTYSKIQGDLRDHDKKLSHEIHVITGMYGYLTMRDRLHKALQHDKGKPHSEHTFVNEMNHMIFHLLIDENHPAYKEFTKIIDILNNAHKKKMKALYVETHGKKVSKPKEAVSLDETKYLIQLLNNQSPHFSTMLDFDDARFAKMALWLHPELFEEDVEKKTEFSLPY